MHNHEQNTNVLSFDNSYQRLPENFYHRVNPTPVHNPALIRLNHALAQDLGFNFGALSVTEMSSLFSGNTLFAGSQPIAQAYAGHQFGHFVPQLGDGRAILLGEIIDKHGNRRDIQLKGAGPSMFSRRGDGRAAIGPVIREYVVSEAMHALGIPTTRALAMVTNGEQVFRETSLPGAIITRIAASHIRVGTFEYFAAQKDFSSVKILADYVIARHYPEAKNAHNPYLALLEYVRDTLASLVAKWMQVGFIHGVMNTDNTSVSGETIDYGPCAFMDAYDPNTCFSSIDHHGRYAYGNQGNIAMWNLSVFASCLLSLLDGDEKKAITLAQESVVSFQHIFLDAWQRGMMRKIGIDSAKEGDFSLVQKLLDIMQQDGADYTLTFRHLCQATGENSTPHNLSSLFKNERNLGTWLKEWRIRLQQEDKTSQTISREMQQTNPAFIPRNHHIEQAIVAATRNSDYSMMERLMTILATPFADQPEHAGLMLPPEPHERVLKTFCGT